jgi:hypothetical protein
MVKIAPFQVMTLQFEAARSRTEHAEVLLARGAGKEPARQMQCNFETPWIVPGDAPFAEGDGCVRGPGL